MAMARWKPSRWTPVLGRPFSDIEDDAILLGLFGFGAGMVGGFKWIGKGMSQQFHVQPAVGAAIMGGVAAAIPLLFGKEYRTSPFSLFAYGVGAGLLSSAIVQIIFPSTSPTP